MLGRALGQVMRRLRSFGRRRELEAGLHDEIRFHIERQVEKNLTAGMAPEEARRHALIRFGGVEQARERARDEFRGALLDHLARDVRYGLRSLRRHPGFTAMAVLSLAIGIGANATIFAVAHAVLFRKSPLKDPGTLVNIYESEARRQFDPMSHPNIEDLRKGTAHVFGGIVASAVVIAQIDRGGAMSPVMGEAVTGGAFALLGVKPRLGRAIEVGDDVARGGHPVVMLSYGYWQRAFGADPAVVGRTLQMGGRNYTIIGVAPADYRGGLPVVTPAFYVPIAMLDELMGIEMLDRRFFHTFMVKARLAPGVSRAQAEHAASLVAASLTRTRPDGWNPQEQFALVPTADVRVLPGVDPVLRGATWLLVAVFGLVLLLACTNLASFLTARALDRGQEVAMRRALGASRGALARQVLVECALLGLGGAVSGLLLAFLLFDVLLSLDLPLPYGMRLDLHLGLNWRALVDWRVLALTAGAGLFAGGLLGLVPAVQGTRADLGSALKTGSRGSEAPGSLRWRNVLVVAQIAISLVLLVGAGFFLRSWQQTLAVDPGFGRAPTSILNVILPVARLTPDAAIQRTRRLLDRFRALPGVESVSLVWPLPLELSTSFTDFTLDDRVPPPGREAFRAEREWIDGEFFNAAGIAVVEGRTFNDGDRRSTQPVAVISRAMARRYWPDGGALGRILHRTGSLPDLVIVGVASDINVRSLGEIPRDVVYESYTQADDLAGAAFVVRSATDAAQMSATLAAAGRQVDPDLRVMQTTTMAQHLATSRLPSQIGALLLSVFAVMGMALAAVGVYGMVRHTVAMRTREVGIRMALGADGAGVTRLLTMHVLRLVFIGGTIGVAGSLLAARFLATLLFGVRMLDPVALPGALVVLGVAAGFSAYLPASRQPRRPARRAAVRLTYSARRTAIGSTRVARQTGTSAASAATIASTDQELASDTQSSGFTPKITLVMLRLTIMARPRPPARPHATHAALSRAMSATRSLRCAPMAIRTPSSRRRDVTTNESRPYTPSAAMKSASAPKALKSPVCTLRPEI
jgi:predicted permease